MIKLLSRLFGFCLLVIAITNFSLSLIGGLPYKNFDPCRMNFISDNLQDYNVLFIGSSRFGRQIDPVQFDSATADYRFHSYNYSFDAAFAPTTINLANHLLDDDSHKIELIILELTPIEFTDRLDPDHVARSIGWYSMDDFAFLANSRSGKSEIMTESLRTSANRFFLLTYRTLAVGEFWKRIVLNADDCSSNSNTAEPLPRKEMTAALNTKMNEIREANSNKNLQSYNLDLSSSSYLNKLNLLDSRCKEADIQLIMVVSPRMDIEEIRYVESLAKLLDQKNVVRLNSATEHPILYSSALTADAKHFNKDGIPIFTESLTSCIRTILEQENAGPNESIDL